MEYFIHLLLIDTRYIGDPDVISPPIEDQTTTTTATTKKIAYELLN